MLLSNYHIDSVNWLETKTATPSMVPNVARSLVLQSTTCARIVRGTTLEVSPLRCLRTCNLPQGQSALCPHCLLYNKRRQMAAQTLVVHVHNNRACLVVALFEMQGAKWSLRLLLFTSTIMERTTSVTSRK